jgi:hypothetical protein
MTSTWHAKTSDGDLIFIRRVLEHGRKPMFEVHRYSGDIGVEPAEEPVPDSIPDELESQEIAIECVNKSWNIVHVFQRDVGAERSLVINFENALRTSQLQPLHVGLGIDDIVALVGLPDAVGRAAIGGAWWLYGSVQVNLYDRRLKSIEIDRGDDAFSAIRFSNWFLNRSSDVSTTEAELRNRSIAFLRGRVGETKLLVFPSKHSARCLIDFDEQDLVHAFYWGDINIDIQMEDTETS